jgi:2-(3-amino-3-carboxypropyl)histidine synthase
MFDKPGVIRKLKAVRARKVLLQIPEGLKTRAQDLADVLEKAGFQTFLSIEPCYGACDLRGREAKSLGCDALLHIGHSDMGIRTSIPVIYEEYRIEFDPTPLLRRSLRDLKPFKRIGLVTTVQYLSSLAMASLFLRKHGKRIVLGSPTRTSHPGQILGCDYSSARSIESKVDCFLFLGTGSFHPLGLSLEVEKQVYFLDFEGSGLTDLAQQKRNLQKIRYANIAKASMASNFGILVSTKPGQSHPKLAQQAKQKLESLGRRAWILVAGELTPEKLLGLNIEAIVNTACPRIREDTKLFKKPIISPEGIDLFPE